MYPNFLNHPSIAGHLVALQFLLILVTAMNFLRHKSLTCSRIICHELQGPCSILWTPLRAEKRAFTDELHSWPRSAFTGAHQTCLSNTKRHEITRSCQVQLASAMSSSLCKEASRVLLYSISEMLLTETIKVLENQNTSNDFFKKHFAMNVSCVLTYSASNEVPYSTNVLVRGTAEQTAGSTRRKLPSLRSWCR